MAKCDGLVEGDLIGNLLGSLEAPNEGLSTLFVNEKNNSKVNKVTLQIQNTSVENRRTNNVGNGSSVRRMCE